MRFSRKPFSSNKKKFEKFSVTMVQFLMPNQVAFHKKSFMANIEENVFHQSTIIHNSQMDIRKSSAALPASTTVPY